MWRSENAGKDYGNKGTKDENMPIQVYEKAGKEYRRRGQYLITRLGQVINRTYLALPEIAGI